MLFSKKTISCAVIFSALTFGSNVSANEQDSKVFLDLLDYHKKEAVKFSNDVQDNGNRFIVKNLNIQDIPNVLIHIDMAEAAYVANDKKFLCLLILSR